LNVDGTMFDVKGPTLYTISLFHDPNRSSDEIVKAIDENIERLRMQPVDAATLERAHVKMRAALYRDIDAEYGFGRANLLALFALFYDDPARINRIESRFAAVTPELIRKTAEEYLRPANRTIYTVVPKAAVAPVVTKEPPPAPDPPKNFTLPEVRRFDLPNGMHVRLMQYGDMPMVTIRLATQTGSIDEAADQVWLAGITGEMMQQGTTTRSAEEIAQQAALMGGSLGVNAGANETTIRTDVFSESAVAAVDLIADVARNPRFPESELGRIRNDYVRKLSMDRTDPRSMVSARFEELLYPDQPYGRSFPTPEMLKGYTLEQVRAFHDHNFGAARSRIYVVGRFDEAAIEKAIRRDFGGWNAGSPPSVPVVNAVSRPGVYLIDRPGAVQSTFLIGLPVIGPDSHDYRRLQVANGVLGGTFLSRITWFLREQKGYSYSPVSYVYVRLRSAYWVEDADVATNATGASVKGIVDEINRLRAEPPTEKELRGVQNFLAGVFVLFNSTRDGIAGQLDNVDLYALDEDYLRDYVASIYAVTPADVQRMAQQYIDPAKLAIVVAGDKKVIADQLRPFGTIGE
jgi:predicted Zn-dependent peptidase